MLLEKSGKKLLIKNLEFFEVLLNSEKFTYLHSIVGNFSCIPSAEFLKNLANEALRKYERMHFESTEVRIEKSWIGFVGELICEQFLKRYGKVIIQKPEIILNKGEYNMGDIWIKSRTGGKQLLTYLQESFQEKIVLQIFTKIRINMYV